MLLLSLGQQRKNPHAHQHQLHLIGVWFCVGFFTGTGWAAGPCELTDQPQSEILSRTD